MVIQKIVIQIIYTTLNKKLFMIVNFNSLDGIIDFNITIKSPPNIFVYIDDVDERNMQDWIASLNMQHGVENCPTHEALSSPLFKYHSTISYRGFTIHFIKVITEEIKPI